ncbi:hypothetical protein [Rhodopseudomonas palustris]
MLGLELKDYIGVAGLVLSVAIWMRTIWREWRRIEVSVSPAFHVYADGEVSTQNASIDIVNRGNRPVYVKAPTLLAPDGKHLSFVGVVDFKKFPKKLEEGESASLCVSYSEISRTLRKQGHSGKVKLRPCCLDATGKRHVGKRWTLDISKEWDRGA